MERTSLCFWRECVQFTSPARRYSIASQDGFGHALMCIFDASDRRRPKVHIGPIPPGKVPVAQVVAREADSREITRQVAGRRVELLCRNTGTI